VILPFITDADVQAAIPPVRDHLSRDLLLAYPTETVYGLGSGPTVPALEALSRLKGRQPGKPFLLLVDSRRMAEEWGLVFTASARALSDALRHALEWSRDVDEGMAAHREGRAPRFTGR